MDVETIKPVRGEIVVLRFGGGRGDVESVRAAAEAISNQCDNLVMVLPHDLSIEVLDDDQLAAAGLQRIPAD